MADVLLFRIDARRYAIPLVQVAEVVPAVNVEPLPDAPPLIEGAVNVRGDILPVLALRARLGHAVRPVTAAEYFILVNALSRRVILRCDAAPEIVTLPGLPEPAGGDLERALADLLPLPEGMALFHDVERLLASADDVAIDAALAGAGSAA